MNNTLRTTSVAVLVATAMLTSGCGGSPDKLSAARSEVAGAAAAASSAEAAIAALGSKLAALTSATPAAVPASTPAAAPAPAPSATPAPAPSATPAPSTSTGGLPAVPSGAALSSLLNTSSTPPAAPAATNLGALASLAKAGLGGALSQLDVTKYCSAIPHADVQALIKGAVGPANNFPLQCGWKGTGLQVSVNPNDDNPKGESELIVGSSAKPLAGVGDTAKWDAPVPNVTLPNLYAQKGAKFTCYVQADAVPQSTIAYTGSDPFFKITDAAELAYAKAEAKLCSDVFAVG